MKNLFFLLLMPFIGFSQLSGTIVVGTSQNNPYKTLPSAIAQISSVGMSGPVTFLIDNDQALASILTISPIAGSSATNTLTIKPNTGKTVVISGGSAWTNSAVIKLNGADNVIFDGSNASGGTSRNMTVRSNITNDWNNEAVIWLASATAADGSNNNVFKNLKIAGSGTGSNTTALNGITFSNTTSSNEYELVANSGNEISNNEFTKLRRAITVRGNATSFSKTVKILNNVFGTSGSEISNAAVYLENADTFVVSGNQFSGIKRDDNGLFIYAIQLEGKSNGGTINANKITSVASNSVIRSSGIGINLDAYTTANLKIYNNFISGIKSGSSNTDDFTNAAYGIVVSSGKDIKVYYNTISINVTNTGFSSAIYCTSASTLMNVRNNIFANTQGNGTRYAIFAEALSSFTGGAIDYNDYYSTQTNVARLGGNGITFASWTAATSETHSVNKIPTFTSATDLHLVETNPGNLANLAGKAVVIAGYTVDFDAQDRDATSPDLGADEIGVKCGGGTVNWTGSAWNNNVGPSSTSKVTISGTYVTGTQGNFSACELQINGNGNLIISSGTSVVIENDLKITGILTVEDGGSLIQVADDAKSQLDDNGQALVKRKTTPIRQYDYTYWSSPVSGAEVASTTNGAGSIFYTYSEAAGWIWTADNAVLNPGVGFISMAPDNLNYNTPQIVEANFYGNPNSGTINKPTTNGYDLIGNPYPSAIDADSFILANITKFSGEIYMWTHSKAMEWLCDGCAGSMYNADDYAIYNYTGSTRTSPNGTLPTGKIASGQGFFVKSIASGNIVFNNSMRVKTAGNNGQFFRSSVAAQSQESEQTIEKNRLWLTLTNNQSAYTQALLGYVTGATNDLDHGFDSEAMNGGNYVSLYTMLGETKLAIQGRAVDFNENDVIPVGFNSTMGGTLTISKELTDGFFESQDIYLLDKLTNTLTNLQESPYTFTAEAGTFNERFELKFTNVTLGTDVPALDKNDIVVIRNAGQVEIKSVKETIASVVIYDLTGKMVFNQNNINDTQFRTAGLNVKGQIVLVQVRTADNREFTTKVVMN